MNLDLLAMEMDKLISEYLASRKSSISTIYTWKFVESIPLNLFGVSVTGSTWYEKTISLKQSLRIYIRGKRDDQEKVAQYFIKDWGGIKRFSKSKEVVGQFNTLAETSAMPANFKPKFSSVSSWSKWASLVCPAWACIYDARVAYSINAINLLNGGGHKIFPTPDGRNTRLSLIDVSTLLLSTKISPIDSSNPKDIEKKYFVPKEDAYIQYVNIVKAVSNSLWGDYGHIHEVEMLLFALADTDIYEDVFLYVSKYVQP